MLITLLISAEALYPTCPCRKRQAKFGIVCECNNEYCDSLDVSEPKGGNQFLFVESCASGERFQFYYGEFSQKLDKTSPNTLNIDINRRYQKIVGFGGAYTGAVVHIMDQLKPNLRKFICRSYYSNDVGMRYSLIRLPIGGCDFDLEPWSYNETFDENTFKILDRRDRERNRHLKELIKISRNREIKILAAPWSAPPFMKHNNLWIGSVDSYLKKEYYQTWAEYYLRWLHLMHMDKMEIFAVSTGNEPSFAINLEFQIMSWSPSEQAKWINENLGPTLKKSNYSHVEIHGIDDGRDMIQHWIREMQKSHPKSLDYLSAFNLHAYFDHEAKSDILDAVQNEFPHKELWYTEMSFGVVNASTNPGPQLGCWERAQRLATILCDNFNHYCCAYIDWNLILDYQGGPNTIDNLIDAPIIASPDFERVYKQPMFYVMAHFSKFCPRNSIRIHSELYGSNVSYIESVSFLRPYDDKVSCILHNTHPNETFSVTICDKVKGKAYIKLKPQSINTVVYSLRPYIYKQYMRRRYFYN